MSRSKNLITVAEGDCETVHWEIVLERYLVFLRGCGRSKNTVDLYGDQISRFYRVKNPSWDDEREDFFHWNGEPQIHSNHRLDSCRRFWEWAVSEGYRRTNPAENVKRRVINKNQTANVSLGDIEKLVMVFREEQKTHPSRWERLRNYSYILFSVGTGVRPGEGLKLRRIDFNIPELFVIVRGEHVKTRQSRVVYIPQNAVLVKLLKKMIKHHAKSGLADESPLFCDSGGNQLSTRSWYHIVAQRAKKAGIRIKPYDLRHAFITHSLIDGANPYDLRDQVGHSNMEMMKRYYH
ncbi:MAG: site-specific integrase, partial [Synergistaceae bacterium]|nr:site-specific integrase [Synergistaceae bacterium]